MPPCRGVFSVLSFGLFLMNSYLRPYIFGGVILGLLLSVIGFFTIPVYHDYVVWSYTTPWVVGLGIILGVFYTFLSNRITSRLPF